MINLLRFILVSLIFLAANPFYAAADEVDKLFRSDEVLKITLQGPFKEINSSRNKSETVPNALLSYQDDEGRTIRVDTAIEVRGNFRLQSKVCRFPPLRLIINDDSAKGTLFAKQKKLKLVTTCKPGSSRYEQYLFKEYLAYRMFNVLSENSFRVRLVEVTYIDSANEGKSDTHYGYFIESVKRLAKRLEHEQVDLPKVNPADHDFHQINLVSMFQYMIGNTDWSAVQGEPDEGCCHNAKLLKDAGNKYLAIPYDFDFSGFVDAEYAFANPKFRLRSVTKRYFRGFCQPEDVVQANLKLFNNRKNEIYALIENQAELSASAKKKSARYLDGFYEVINDSDQLNSKILDKCRNYTQPED